MLGLSNRHACIDLSVVFVFAATEAGKQGVICEKNFTQLLLIIFFRQIWTQEF